MSTTNATSPSKVVLAYSGGLDTSIILHWLRETYGCKVVTFTADIGQGDELEPARAKALAMGVAPEDVFIEDLREEFARDFVFPMFRANAVYEGEYLLGTSIARPLIAKRLVEIATATGADAISHGATGKGNDQVRFELGAYALKPDIRVIAPWREWDLGSRESLMAYASSHGIPIERKRGTESPFSMDANMLHISYEGGPLEDPWYEPPAEMWLWSVSPQHAPNEPAYVDLAFAGGDIVAVDGQPMTPGQVLATLNALGAANGVGRIDMVENRLVGIKSREIYEAPAATVLHVAHRELEALVIPRDLDRLKAGLSRTYADLVYDGLWFSPTREAIDAFVANVQQHVTGTVRLKLSKGDCRVVGRKSPASLYDTALATYDEGDKFDHEAAEGFIEIWGLPVANVASKRRAARARAPEPAGPTAT